MKSPKQHAVKQRPASPSSPRNPLERLLAVRPRRLAWAALAGLLAYSLAASSSFLPTRAAENDALEAGAATEDAEGIVQVANLVYAGTKSSRCFADHFLIKAQRETTIATSRRFHAVKLTGDQLYQYPLVIMTGEGDFHLAEKERQSLRKYIERGGFLLASAGCSSTEWDRAFRREMAAIFPDNALKDVGMDHPIFSTVYEINKLEAAHGTPQPLLGISLAGRVGVIYSPDGLNDTAHTTGCCCCGGNELRNAEQINVNILAYALTY